MATDTVKLAGKPVNKKVLYISGAAALGVVGYAWWTKGMQGAVSEEPEPELPEPVPEPTDTPGFDVVGGGPPPQTNADWNAKAVQSLLNIGYDVVAVQAAIGKFLQRRALNVTEAALVEAAIAAAGYPPENGPWVIIREDKGGVVPKPTPTPTPTPTPKPKPTVPGRPGFVNITKTGRSTYDINFVPPAGATKFRYRRSGSSAWSGAYGTSIIIKSGTFKGIAKIKARALFARRTTFSVAVQAGNNVGWGPEQGSSNRITLP